jgi:hypothetical protein
VPVAKPSNPAAGPKPKRRKPYKLHDRTINALVRSINECADLPIEAHCGMAGIHKDTFNEWRKIAEARPGGEHARQMAKVDRALHAAWKRLHEAAVRHKPTEVLFRRHREFYPNERQQMEISAPDGLPLFPENPFHFVLELNRDSPPLEQKPFEIEQVGGANDGQRERWEPPAESNGETPP